MESRFASLLSTNYVPLQGELDEIHKLLLDPVDQLNQLESEITHFQSIVDKLASKRDRLHSDITRHRNLLAPIRRIPEELLQEIFCHCLPVEHNAVMSCHEAPLLLGMVCSRWRSISLATPRLWSSIHVVLSSDVPPWPGQPEDVIEVREHPDIHGAVQTWLNRSGSLPLSISLFQAPYTYASQEHVDQLMSTLIDFSSRWKNVSLNIPSPSPSQLSSLSPGSLPLLETFSFHSTVNSPSPLPEFTPLDIFLAPQIRNLSTHHLGTVPRDIEWSRLTSLSLESAGHGEGMLAPSTAVGILRKCSNLIHCELDFASGWGGISSFNDHESVTMPLLESLIVHEGTLPLKPFLEQLRLPALVSLEFSASPPRHHIDLDVPEEPSICVLLHRLDSLRNLTLSALNLTHIALMSCLRSVPSIVQLSILGPRQLDPWPFMRNIWTPFQDEVAALLTPTQGQPLICPSLKVLECNPCHASDTALLEFIKQRTIHAPTHDVRRLERVDVIFHRQRELDIPNTLPPETLAGTSFTFQYRAPSVVQRRMTPRAGLEKPDRLQIPTNIYRRLYH